jgi:hypothetical protein
MSYALVFIPCNTFWTKRMKLSESNATFALVISSHQQHVGLYRDLVNLSGCSRHCPPFMCGLSNMKLLLIIPRTTALRGPRKPTLIISVYADNWSVIAVYHVKRKGNLFLCLTMRPLLWSSGQSSWLQIRRPGFDSRHYQKKVVGLERGPFSLVSTTEELIDRKVAVPF